MALRVDEAKRRIREFDSNLNIEIICTKSFKEKNDYTDDACFVIKQELLKNTIKLTVAYFDN